MCHNFAKRVSVLIGLLIPVAASAQNSNKENAPYSRYGIGEMAYGSNALLRGLGNASTAYKSTTAINSDNPATYSSLKFTTYEAGLMGATRNLKTGGNSYSTGSASLAYLNIGIPLGKYGGMALGLRPQSKVFYHNTDTVNINGIGNVVEDYSGDGGLNFAYLGLSGKYKGFSLGVNAGYMFGTIENKAGIINYRDTVRVLNSSFAQYTKIGGIYWKAGAQYETALNKKTFLRFGATASVSQNLNADRENLATSVRKIGTVTDTSYVSSNLSGKIVLPLSYSFGAQIGGEKWSAIVDYSVTAWSQFRNYGLTDSLVDNASRFSAGFEYTPNPTSVYKYLSRVTYRVGFYYGTDHVKLRNNEIKSYAVTAGASLPFRRTPDRVHLAAEYGKRGTVSNGLIEEGFFKFTLGISLNATGNDSWFKKRRYD
jgi:hypothetical protein